MQSFYLTIGQRCTWIGLGIVAHAQLSLAAGFDCSHASNDVETRVCANAELSRLDDVLTKTYTAMLASSTSKQDLLREQRRWLKKRNTCQIDGCIKIYYMNRISQLHYRDRSLKEIIPRMEVSNNRNPEYCDRLLGALQKERDVVFVEPLAVSDNIEAPSIRKSLGQCNPQKFITDYEFDARIWDGLKLSAMKESERNKYGTAWSTHSGYRIYPALGISEHLNGHEIILFGAGNRSERSEPMTDADFTNFKLIDTQKCKVVSDAQVWDVVNRRDSIAGLLRFEDETLVYSAARFPNESLWGISIQKTEYQPRGKQTVFMTTCSYVAKDSR